MSAISYQQWPFDHPSLRLPEQQERWWKECFLPHAEVALISEKVHWRIVTGAVGSGKSTTLAYLAAFEQEHGSLVIDYLQEYWPDSPQALIPEGGHFSQIMALAAIAIRDAVAKIADQCTPDELNLIKNDRQFLRWMVEKYLGQRAFERWVEALPPVWIKAIRPLESVTLYRTDHLTLDIKGQIDELSNLTHKLSFQKVLLFIDVPNLVTPAQLESMVRLFGWLDLMHHNSFGIVAAISSKVFQRADIAHRTRGRVRVAQLIWRRDQMQAIAENHLAATTDGKIKTLCDLASVELIDALFDRVEEEYDGPSPLGSIQIVETLLHFTLLTPGRLSISHLDDILRYYFSTYMLLTLDPILSSKGVWRGPKFIELDDVPYYVLTTLMDKAKEYNAKRADKELIRGAGKKDNIPTQVKRLRKQIEPFESSQNDQEEKQPRKTKGSEEEEVKKFIYVKHTNIQGYYLEHYQIL